MRGDNRPEVCVLEAHGHVNDVSFRRRLHRCGKCVGVLLSFACNPTRSEPGQACESRTTCKLYGIRRTACTEPTPFDRPVYLRAISNASLTSRPQVLIIFALLKQFVLESYMLHSTGVHGRAYAQLKPRDQRTLVNHHLSLAIKMGLLVVGMQSRCFSNLIQLLRIAKEN